MKRVILAAAFVGFLAVPSTPRAEVVPSNDRQSAIQIVIFVMVADRTCPDYDVDADRLTMLMDGTRLSSADLSSSGPDGEFVTKA